MVVGGNLLHRPERKMRQNKEISHYILFLYENYIKITYYTIYQRIMDNEDLINKLKIYEEENTKLKEQLDKYKNLHKPYYEKNKEIVNEKAKERLKKIRKEDPDKLKEINRKAYLKRKEKMKELKNNENI